jgi:plastocyanin
MKEHSIIKTRVIVNPADEVDPIGKYIAEGDGAITEATLEELDREYVLFMVGSTFWGQELYPDEQIPLWTNPTLGSEEDELVRFNVIAIGDDHTFHMHAHRWVESSTNDNIIDTKLLNDGSRHSFIVRSGADVGEGMWQYHCHVFPHMQSGMHGHVHVGDNGDPQDTIPGANPYNVLFTGDSEEEEPGVVTFKITDEPGTWFESTRGDALAGLTVTKSLEVMRPGDSVNFVMTETDTVHTITSLLWPTGEENMPFDQTQAYKGGGIVQLTEPGLYVFTCKVHPYMFGGVIVDDPETQIELEGEVIRDNELLSGVLGHIVDEDGGLLLDLGATTFSMVNGYQIPTGSDLSLRLAKTFFVATAPENWRDYASLTPWNPSYPALPVKASVYTGGDLNNPANFVPVAIQNLDGLMEFYFDESSVVTELIDLPEESVGVGEVWVNAQFEKTASKTKPGTATAVDTSTWKVTKKVALPGYNMNNPHNMWTDKDQTVIYQTEWFSNKLTTFDRETGAPISQMKVGESPSHVMTRPNNDDITVALNGEEGVVEILATTSPSDVNRIIAMQGYGLDPTHPHAQWISSDGQTMITPNAFTHDATIYGFDTETISSRTATGILPIATAMTPDDEFGTVANLLSSTITVVDLDDGSYITDINLLGDYNPVILVGINDDDGLLETALSVDLGLGVLATTDVSALPIQTPISPDGQYMVTANTLTATVSITDVSDEDPENWFIAETLPCDPGCHGVQFGAKSGDGYYAYVSSKFANDLIVIDMDTLDIAGRILLNTDVGTVSDDTIVSLHGMGGQGVMPIPNVYNGWVQNLPDEWKDELSDSQKNPLSP